MKTKLFLLALCLPLVAAGSPRIVTSIAPIHSIVSQIAEGVSEPQLLVSPERSPHDFQLTPTQAQQMMQADLVIWVGDGVEGFMHRFERRIDANAKLPLAGKVGELLALRDHGHDHGHDHGEYDQHIWLSVEKMQQVAKVVAEKLIRIDAQNQSLYEANLAATLAKLAQLDTDLSSKLADYQGQPYVVFHDAYQYFEQAYNLASVAAVMSPSRAGSSLARQFELRKMLAEQNVSCVFSEPQFSDQQVQRLVGNSYTVAVLDPLGAEVEPGNNHYTQMMHAIADSLVECLGANNE
ncbi:zinc ABC transporter substrate-binding protein [Salinibius halmophilus]|uniref:zinc ABC transporter substrate-binding protein n=1 Tax=Salinibius halmophilus TaxID=1853216 RepID=UPI0013146D38|nr:zinc ABC transporter substrate-binding protein [Salinibius halmophilus]